MGESPPVLGVHRPGGLTHLDTGDAEYDLYYRPESPDEYLLRRHSHGR